MPSGTLPCGVTLLGIVGRKFAPGGGVVGVEVATIALEFGEGVGAVFQIAMPRSNTSMPAVRRKRARAAGWDFELLMIVFFWPTSNAFASKKIIQCRNQALLQVFEPDLPHPPIACYGFAGCGVAVCGFGIRKVYEKPNTMVRPSGRARAWYSS